MALSAGQSLAMVLAILEQGRGVLSQSMEEMRADCGSLRTQQLQYADELNRIRGALGNPLHYIYTPGDTEG